MTGEPARDDGPVDDRPEAAPHFFCDAMLGGLARALRAVGYDAAFEHGIDDGDLVARAAATGAVLLSSDGPLFDRRAMRNGSVRGLFVPRHAPVLDQLVFVMRAFGLGLRDVRCMACGGALVAAAREDIADEVPARSRGAYERFWRCARCRRVYWQGTHWTRIDATRDEVARRL